METIKVSTSTGSLPVDISLGTMAFSVLAYRLLRWKKIKILFRS